MSFGQSVTTFIADLYPTDPLAPQVTSDFVQALPPSPIMGATVSTFVQELYPIDPLQPADLGWELSQYINDVQGPDLGDGGLLFL